MIAIAVILFIIGAACTSINEGFGFLLVLVGGMMFVLGIYKENPKQADYNIRRVSTAVERSLHDYNNRDSAGATNDNR